MGMTKALMEKTAQAFAETTRTPRPPVSLTRYGNVMYSRGSVIRCSSNSCRPVSR